MVGVLILLALTSPSAPIALLDARAATSPDEFSACFTKAEEGRGRAWAYLPNEHGGMLTDSGAHGAPASYWLQVQGTDTAAHVRLFAADSGQGSASLVEAVERCR